EAGAGAVGLLACGDGKAAIDDLVSCLRQDRRWEVNARPPAGVAPSHTLLIGMDHWMSTLFPVENSNSPSHRRCPAGRMDAIGGLGDVIASLLDPTRLTHSCPSNIIAFRASP